MTVAVGFPGEPPIYDDNVPVTHPTGGPGFADTGHNLSEWADIVAQTLLARGLTGPPGPAGEQGPAGPAGTAYVHEQASPAMTWVVVHNLGRNPAAVSTTDFAGSWMIGEIVNQSPNTTTISFTVAVSGRAVVS